MHSNLEVDEKVKDIMSSAASGKAEKLHEHSNRRSPGEEFQSRLDTGVTNAHVVVVMFRNLECGRRSVWNCVLWNTSYFLRTKKLTVSFVTSFISLAVLMMALGAETGLQRN